MREGGRVPSLRFANLWIHRNSSGRRDLRGGEPFLLLLKEGIAIYPDDGSDYPRFPLLGLRSIINNNLKLFPKSYRFVGQSLRRGGRPNPDARLPERRKSRVSRCLDGRARSVLRRRPIHESASARKVSVGQPLQGGERDPASLPFSPPCKEGARAGDQTGSATTARAYLTQSRSALGYGD